MTKSWSVLFCLHNLCISVHALPLSKHFGSFLFENIQFAATMEDQIAAGKKEQLADCDRSVTQIAASANWCE